MDIEIVRMCLQHLALYKIVKMVDIFLFNNIYAATKNIAKIAFDQQLQQKCIDFVFAETEDKKSEDDNKSLQDDEFFLQESTATQQTTVKNFDFKHENAEIQYMYVKEKIRVDQV